MKICAYLIVRNEVVLLPYALRSIASLCDEIFVVDNGSTDGTPEIARQVSEKVRLIYLPGRQGGGFDDPATPEDVLRNAGLAACKEAKADLILRWDADEILYEGQEEHIRGLVSEYSYGGWFFCCHRFVGSFEWVQDLRWGEPGCVELHKTVLTPGWEWTWHGTNGETKRIRWGETRQALHGKIVLFRGHPYLRYVQHPAYIGLHSSEFETAHPRNYRITDVWYAHLEWCRSNRRLYEKAMLYYDLVADPNDYCHTDAFKATINPDCTLVEQRLRPFTERLPAVMHDLQLPVEMTVVPDQYDRLAIVERRWIGEEW
jgi:glycosyltransferase involved in cell wall biosynthesis